MYWKRKTGDLYIATTSIALGTYLLFVEVIENDPVSFGVIPGVSNALIGSAFIIKGMMWGKSCFLPHIKPLKHIDYFGLIISVFTFISAAKVLQTGILYSRGAWFHLDQERYPVGILLIIAAFYMLYYSIECVRYGWNAR